MNNFISTSEAAKLLGISRVAVLKKIKKGQIEAEKIGRNYVVHKSNLNYMFADEINLKEKNDLDKAVKKVLNDYGEAIKLLGTE